MTTQQQVALVTGASSGIGKEVAHRLVEAGFQVVGTSRHASGLTGRDGLTYVDLDVSNDASVIAAVEHVIGRYGRLDVLVNNAGIGSLGAAEELSVAQDRNVIDVNVVGVMRMMKAVLPHMRAQGRGRIVNISSIVGLVPQPHMAVYVASKHALEGYSESVDHEVREYGVRVVLVEPGPTSTAFGTAVVRPEVLIPAYAHQRETFAEVIADSSGGADDAATVAKVVVNAATDAKPRLRYPAGGTATRVSALRRFVPARVFDKQIRKINRFAH
ncbi:oxidoreductase [Phycicoccus sp. Soil802]|uniref:oxidoreductase n=1 Tax=Phycicoccus sp. Soil802 TaxID=1736414 RepID=UPI0007036EC7|nr:oxidoreductase [Phycicoccus sp. Soil802]KRF22372.1 oxidoreductase [Phycicoccus sp. Soil802]